MMGGCSRVYWRESPCDSRVGKPEMRFDLFGTVKRAERQKDAEAAACEQKRHVNMRKAQDRQSHLSEIYPNLQPLPTPGDAVSLLEGRMDRHFYSIDGGMNEIRDCMDGKCASEDNRRKITPNLYEVYNGGLHDSFSILYRDDTKLTFENCPQGQYSYWRIHIMEYATPFGDTQKAPALVRLGCTAEWSDPFAAPGTDEQVSVHILPKSSEDSSKQEQPVKPSSPAPRVSSSEPTPVISAHIQSFFPESAKAGTHDKRASNLYKHIRPE